MFFVTYVPGTPALTPVLIVSKTCNGSQAPKHKNKNRFHPGSPTWIPQKDYFWRIIIFRFYGNVYIDYRIYATVSRVVFFPPTVFPSTPIRTFFPNHKKHKASATFSKHGVSNVFFCYFSGSIQDLVLEAENEEKV